ncbi:MAG: hypothetical protein ACOC3G_08655 [Phycisphaeraceae bacterium]
MPEPTSAVYLFAALALISRRRGANRGKRDTRGG